ncbi:MAG: DinB family protein [Armatimonadetes bacterium]|nr:DinB family protein [Armatimonadota bacterium]NOG93373.1 DinB family protein [Armatimonadota bacterium]
MRSTSNVEILRRAAESAFSELTNSIDGVTEPQSWARLEQGGKDYLHTDASILGIVLHVASAKLMYASAAFRQLELNWRSVAEKVEAIEPNWERSVELHHEAQAYWLRSWEGITDEELESECPTIWGATWPAWRVIQAMTHHDAYHAGQIAVLRYAVSESSVPPASVAEDIREHCSSLPTW